MVTHRLVKRKSNDSIKKNESGFPTFQKRSFTQIDSIRGTGSRIKKQNFCAHEYYFLRL